MTENNMLVGAPRECKDCVHWSRNPCVDSNGKKIIKGTNGDKYWCYETCKKNWGLPQNAFTSAVKCHMYTLNLRKYNIEVS